MHNIFAQSALPLLAAGYSPLPILPNTKRPALAGWQRFSDTPMASDEVERFRRSPIGYGVGVALGLGLIAIDIDTEDDAVLAAIRCVLPRSPVAKRGRRGTTDFYCDPSGIIRGRKFAGAAGMLVEILGPRNQTVLPPTLHPETDRPYRWYGGSTLENTPVNNLPIIEPDIADRLEAVLAPRLAKRRGAVTERLPARAWEVSERDRERQRRYAEAILSRDLKKLSTMARNSGRNNAAFRLVCRIGRWVHHGVISPDQLVDNVLHACKQNQLVRDNGRKAVLETIASGLRRSSGDQLPDLGGRRHG